MLIASELTKILALSGLFVVASLVTRIRERNSAQGCSRIFAAAVACLGLVVAIANSVGVDAEAGTLIQGSLIARLDTSYIHKISFEGRHLCSVISLVLFLGGVLLAPSVPLVPVRMSRVFLMQGLLVALIDVHKLTSFLIVGAVLIFLCIKAVRYHSRSLPGDERSEMRVRTFTRYQALALAFILGSCALRALAYGRIVPATEALQVVDLSFLCLSSAIVLGLFPFHGWLVPFLGAPRSTIFLPIIFIETGMLFFFRVYAPIVSHQFSEASIFLFFPIIGLLYSAIQFFGERRLKRIPGYLYLSHISLMALSADDFGPLGMATSLLDGVNMLLALLGLLGVCALLTARFGVRGVLTPSGLGMRFPELAVCYLICVLSLVGFPGTLGFIQEEIMMGEGIEHHAFLIAIIAVALTLNGFAGFRLFARIFYGQPFEGKDTEIGLSLRERSVIILILFLILLNGMAPSFIVRTLTHIGTNMPGAM